MKLLLDENLPHDLRHLLPAHDVYTVTFMQWSGIKNGSLLQLAATENFDVLITLDSGIEHQQNLHSLACSVVIVHAASNKLDDLRPKISELMRVLSQLRPCTLTHVT